MLPFLNKQKIKLDSYKKVIVIIGGAGYVGRAYLDRFQDKKDILLVVVSRNASGFKDNIITIRGDITLDIENIVKKILAITGRIDILIHLAATYAFETSDFLTHKNMLREFDVNAIAPMLFTQEVNQSYWKHQSPEENLLHQRKVIVVGSQAGNGKSSREDLITYSATKAALERLFDYYSSYLRTIGIETVFLKPGNLRQKEKLDDFLKNLMSVSLE